MRLSKSERLWIAGLGPRPYALSDTEDGYARMSRGKVKEGLRMLSNGMTHQEVARAFRELGTKLSEQAIIERLKHYENTKNAR